ncbi:MAG: hypothetical protein AB8G86_25090 [Saprospiraceae bacterium]
MKKVSISLFILFLFSFLNCSENSHENPPQSFTKEVEVRNIKATKKYAKKMYGAEVDRIVFEVEYIYKKRVYKSSVTMRWVYLSPKLINIVDKKAFEKLIVKCDEASPKKIMVFVSKPYSFEKREVRAEKRDLISR